MKLHSLLLQTSLLVTALAAPYALLAETPDSTKTANKGHWEFGGYISSLTIDEEAAAREFIESDAFTFGGQAEYLNNWALVSLALEYVLYDDEAGFSQRTTDGFGNEDDSSSSAGGFLASAAAGPKWQLGNDNNTLVFIQGGAAQVFASERSIGNCSDCYSEKIEIDGGLFAKIGVAQNVGAVALGIHYRHFFSSDDLDSSLSLFISTSY